MRLITLLCLGIVFLVACEVQQPTTTISESPEQKETIDQKIVQFQQQLRAVVESGTLTSKRAAYSFCTAAFDQIDHEWNEEEKNDVCRVMKDVWKLPQAERSAEMICTGCKQVFEAGTAACVKEEQLDERGTLCVNQVVDLFNAYEANQAGGLDDIKARIPQMDSNTFFSECQKAAAIHFGSWWNGITSDDRADICSAGTRYFGRSGQSIAEECSQSQYAEECVDLLEELFVRG
jgi:hypothetical protein